jgi:outer membrane murein-binding lipoprotein Lpp
MGGTRRRTTALIGAALVAGIMLAGCSAGASDHSASSAGAPGLSEPQAAAPAEGDAAAKPGGAAEGKDQPAEAPDLSVDQRSIIYTGSITIRVEDVNQAAAKAGAIALGAGGFVGGDKRNTSDGSSDATMVLRVPADRFTTVVDQLSRTLGKEEQRGISTDDVTEQTVDLDARILVQQARVDTGRKLLGQAKTLNDLVMLEKEVATRESDLASLQAKKRRLADLTALSTITVVLLDPQAAVVAKDDGPPGFLAGLEGGWKALLASLTVLLAVLGALLPWIIALGVPVWAIFYLVRRYTRRRPHPATPALATAGAPFPHAGPPHAGPPHAGPQPARSTPARSTPAGSTPDERSSDADPDTPGRP